MLGGVTGGVIPQGEKPHAAGHGEPQLPVPGRSRACLTLSRHTERAGHSLPRVLLPDRGQDYPTR
jgi:hypothetical protein